MSIKQKVSIVYPAIQAIRNITLLKEIRYKKPYGKTSTTRCLLAKIAITEGKIRKHPGIDILSPPAI
jgi:hypothetical protein